MGQRVVTDINQASDCSVNKMNYSIYMFLAIALSLAVFIGKANPLTYARLFVCNVGTLA